MSDLTMANVEALAGSEINDEDCVSASNRYCSVLIVTPNGNYLVQAKLPFRYGDMWKILHRTSRLKSCAIA